MPNRRDSDESVEAISSNDEAADDDIDGFDDGSGAQGSAQGAGVFTEDDMALIYGARKAPPVGAEPSLVRANVQMRTFGKSERSASRDGMNLVSRLRSIRLDSDFAQRVREAFPQFKVYANLRNGLWYLRTPPDGECRFRSSDGHALSWGFYIARANLQTAIAATESTGVLIVDSTRFGKTFPDSFNRTVPLWCAVVNRALGFEDAKIELPRWLPQTECSRISDEQLQQWSNELKQLAANSGVELKSKLPLRPFWIANDKMSWNRCTHDLDVVATRIEDASDSCIPILCVSASALVDPAVHREQFSWNYIPGGADDEENWAPAGLTSTIFWDNVNEILDAPSVTTCENLIGALMREHKHVLSSAKAAAAEDIEGADRCQVNSLVTVVWGVGEIPVCKQRPNEYDATWLRGQDKAWGRRNPNAWSSRALPEVISTFASRQNPTGRFVILGGDAETVAALAVAVLIVFFDNTGKELRSTWRDGAIDKPTIRAGEGLLVSLVDRGTLAIPRRLVKELIDFFASPQWPKKVTWKKAVA